MLYGSIKFVCNWNLSFDKGLVISFSISISTCIDIEDGITNTCALLKNRGLKIQICDSKTPSLCLEPVMYTISK